MRETDSILERELADKLRILRHMRERNKISKNDYERYIRILRRHHYVDIVGREMTPSLYDLISRILSFLSVLFVLIFLVISSINLVGKLSDDDSSKFVKYSTDEAIKENEQYLYTSQGRKDCKNPNHIEMHLLPEEEIQTNRIRDITIRLADLDMDLPLISSVFGLHWQRLMGETVRNFTASNRTNIGNFGVEDFANTQIQLGGVLRFRVFLRDKRYFDAMLIPGCPNISYANSSTDINVQIRDIACFRSTPTNCVPLERLSECLSNDEARELFHWVVAVAYETKFDLWESVSAFLPDGFWNKYHPVWSSFVLAMLGLLYILWRWWNRRRDAKVVDKVKGEKGEG